RSFVLRFMFVLARSGTVLLLTGSFKNLAQADWGSIALVTITAAFGIAALAGGLQGWLLHKTTFIERWALVIAGLMLVYPAPLFDYIGFAIVIVVFALQKMRSTTVAAGSGCCRSWNALMPASARLSRCSAFARSAKGWRTSNTCP